MAICLVTGNPDTIARLNISIEGIRDKPGAPARKYLVAFQKARGFDSYGKEQGGNAPVGKRAAFAYTTALNHLLASKQRIQIGDTSTMFWAAQENRLELPLSQILDEPPPDNPDQGTNAVKQLFEAPKAGTPAIYDDGTRFYVLGLAPNSARVAVRFWQVAALCVLLFGGTLVYPLQRVEPSNLATFVQAGGHVIVADDFGDSAAALSRMGLLRAEVNTAEADRYYRSRMYAPIATPLASGNPLVRGVAEVVTNHPAVLTEVTGATPILGFGGSRGAVVVAGERGTGRFVVVSDPSILINRMMQFPGNMNLAVNMLRWLDRGGRARRVILLRGDVPM